MNQRTNYGAKGEEVRAESLVSECHPTVLSQQHYSLSYSPHRHHLANQCLHSDGNYTSSISNFSIPLCLALSMVPRVEPTAVCSRAKHHKALSIFSGATQQKYPGDLCQSVPEVCSK